MVCVLFLPRSCGFWESPPIPKSTPGVLSPPRSGLRSAPIFLGIFGTFGIFWGVFASVAGCGRVSPWLRDRTWPWQRVLSPPQLCRVWGVLFLLPTGAEGALSRHRAPPESLFHGKSLFEVILRCPFWLWQLGGIAGTGGGVGAASLTSPWSFPFSAPS